MEPPGLGGLQSSRSASPRQGRPPTAAARGKARALSRARAPARLLAPTHAKEPTMAEYSEHAPGTFCWIELATSNAPAAKRFYAELFGWTHHDDPIGPDRVYTMLFQGGKGVGALYGLGPQQAGQGVPSCWGSYVTVAD